MWIMCDHCDQELREELTTCKRFLVDSEFVRGRRHVFNFASNRIDPSFPKDKLQHVYENLQCAPKIKRALMFILRNVEDGNVVFFMHIGSQLIANKENSLLELQKSVDELKIVELST